MTDKIQVTVLVENTASLNLLGEHGLSFWVETPAGAVMLDTGQGEVLLRNAHNLGVRLSDAKAIILSHGHYDHSGGLEQAAKEAAGATIYLHAAALEPKYARRPDGSSRPIGIPASSRKVLGQAGRRVLWVEGPMQVLPGLHVTGAIPRATNYEDTGGPFFLDSGCSRPDPLTDDQAVYFDTPKGLVVLLGCAHSGVVNTLRYVGQLTDGRPIHAVIGGMHLLSAGEARMAATAEALRQLDVGKIGAGHCTGFAAMARLDREFPGRCFHCAAGTRLEFDL